MGTKTFFLAYKVFTKNIIQIQWKLSKTLEPFSAINLVKKFYSLDSQNEDHGNRLGFPPFFLSIT